MDLKNCALPSARCAHHTERRLALEEIIADDEPQAANTEAVITVAILIV